MVKACAYSRHQCLSDRDGVSEFGEKLMLYLMCITSKQKYVVILTFPFALQVDFKWWKSLEFGKTFLLKTKTFTFGPRSTSWARLCRRGIHHLLLGYFLLNYIKSARGHFEILLVLLCQDVHPGLHAQFVAERSVVKKGAVKRPAAEDLTADAKQQCTLQSSFQKHAQSTYHVVGR